MKNIFRISGVILLILTIFLIQSCKKDEPTPPITVTDIDANVYHTVTIGAQMWMDENLKTTKYNDGTLIPIINEDTEWEDIYNTESPAYCWYNNDASTYKATYGALYNWYTVNTGKLCPTGWHVPTDAEWTTLTNYLTINGYGYEGSGSDIGKSMAATLGWTTWSIAGTIANDQASNNSSGFTALPGGFRYFYGAFSSIGYFGHWWSSTEVNTGSAWAKGMDGSYSVVDRFSTDKVYGFSVRCLRD